MQQLCGMVGTGRLPQSSLLLDQTEAGRAEKNFFKTALPPLISGSGGLPRPVI